MSDARLKSSLTFVLEWEGGFVNDPDDPGGATNKGITQAVYDGYRKQHGLAHQSVEKISDAEVAEIYQNNYWNAAHRGSLPEPLDMVMFDTAVNMGVGTAVTFLQHCLHVAEDGHFGPATAGALEAHKHAAPGLASCFLAAREARYHSIAVRHPNMSKFLKGWLNRLHALEKAIATG